MSCPCEACRKYDEAQEKKLADLGAWLVKRGNEGKNADTTRSILRRKLIKMEIIELYELCK